MACAPSWNGEGKNAGAAVPALVLRADESACNPHMVFLISLSPSIPVSLRACIPCIHSHVPFPCSFFFVMLCEPICHRSILDLPRCLPCLHSLFGYDILNGRRLSFFFPEKGRGGGEGQAGRGGGRQLTTYTNLSLKLQDLNIMSCHQILNCRPSRNTCL